VLEVKELEDDGLGLKELVLHGELVIYKPQGMENYKDISYKRTEFMNKRSSFLPPENKDDEFGQAVSAECKA